MDKTERQKMFKSGFVSIIGRPNAGKSTLLNAMLGEKLSIVSEKPQTTRTVVRGIKTLKDCQIIFVDTPGIHTPKGMLNEAMVNSAVASAKDADAVVYLTEADRGMNDEDLFIINGLKRLKCPVILAINKIDLVRKDALLSRISEYNDIFKFTETFLVSALSGDGVEALLKAIKASLPEGPRYFPEDIISDQPERFIAAEIIREKVFLLTRDEVPYSAAVEIDEFKEKKGGVVVISATINVERDSQKAIIIGNRGSMLKNIGVSARLDIEKFLCARVFLKLFVRVREDWRKDKRALKDFGLI